MSPAKPAPKPELPRVNIRLTPAEHAAWLAVAEREPGLGGLATWVRRLVNAHVERATKRSK